MELKLSPEVVLELRRRLFRTQLAEISESEVFGPLFDFKRLNVELEHGLIVTLDLLCKNGTQHSIFELCERLEHLLRSNRYPDGDLTLDNDVKSFAFLPIVDTEVILGLAPIL